MKVKTLVKLNAIKEQPARLVIHDFNDREYEMDVTEYIAWKEAEIWDWFYISGDPSENTEDKIIIYV